MNESSVLLHSGHVFDVLNPSENDIIIDDVAHALSYICRGNGHLNKFYCVGEHSILCAMVAKCLGYSILEQLYCLLHDTSEAIVGDLPKPLKLNIDVYNEIEGNVMNVMWKLFNVPKPTPEQYAKVKYVDKILHVNEMKQLMNQTVTVEGVRIEDIMYVNLRSTMCAGESKAGFIESYEYLHSMWKEKELL